MAIVFKGIAYFWDILHSQEIRDQHPNTPLAMVAKDYAAYLLGFGNPAKNFSTAKLVIQIDILIKRGIFEKYGVSNEVVQEIIDDLNDSSVQHKALIKATLDVEILDQNAIANFIGALNDGRWHEAAAEPMEITRPNEHVKQLRANDYYKQGKKYQKQLKFKEADVAYSIALKTLPEESTAITGHDSYVAAIYKRYIEMASTAWDYGKKCEEKSYQESCRVGQFAIDMGHKARDITAALQLNNLEIKGTSQSDDVVLLSWYVKLAEKHFRVNDFKSAVDICKAGLVFADKVSSISLEFQDQWLRGNSVLYKMLADIFSKNTDESFKLLIISIKAIEAITEKTSKDNGKLADFYWHAAYISNATGRNDAVIVFLQKAIHYCAAALQQDPGLKKAHVVMVNTCRELCKIYLSQDNISAVVDCYEQNTKSLTAADPSLLEDYHAFFGEMFYRYNGWEKSAAAYKIALSANMSGKQQESKQESKEEKSIVLYQDRIQYAENKLAARQLLKLKRASEGAPEDERPAKRIKFFIEGIKKPSTKSANDENVAANQSSPSKSPQKVRYAK